MSTAPRPNQPLTIRKEQMGVFRERQLQIFAVEVAARLSEVAAGQNMTLPEPTMKDFALAQLEKAETGGLRNRDEMMAFCLCALLHGDGFDQKMPQVRAILANQNYDRAVLLTQLAITGLKKDASEP